MPTPVPSYTTVDTLVSRVRKRLEDNPAFVSNLSGSIGTSDTTLNITTGQGSYFVQGDVLSFDDQSYEDCYVQSVSTDTLTIVRAWNGTTAASHTNGAVILKDPRFRPQQVQNGIQRIVDELWPDGWQVKAIAYDLFASTLYYPFQSDMIDIVSAVQKRTTTPIDYVTYGSKMGMPTGYRGLPIIPVLLPTADFANNSAFYLPQHDNETNSMTVFYRALVDTSTIRAGIMSDCVEAGACWFLTAAKDVPRTALNTTQADQSQPPNVLLRDAQFWFGQYTTLRKKMRLQLLALGLGPLRQWE